MGEAATKLEVKKNGPTTTKAESHTAGVPAKGPFQGLRRQIEQTLEDFEQGLWPSTFGQSLLGVAPFWRRGGQGGTVPAVDVAEKKDAFEITAELPGLDEHDIEVKIANGLLSIAGEKKEEKEEKKKDYYLSERHYGAFQRSFSMPEGVDANKVEATFKKGVLTVTLPKTPEAQKKAKTIPVKAK